MKPLITALVDTYNQERYIEEALVRVVEQEIGYLANVGHGKKPK
jgi:hypothetical protein